MSSTLQTAPEVSVETTRLASYLADAWHTELPPAVGVKTAIHIVDTLAAIVSGAPLDPGVRGAHFARTQADMGTSTVIGAGFRTTPILAALANGMSAHADETDDSHPRSISHPGCGVIPAALAVAEHLGRSGAELVRAVAAGYDAGTRVVLALGKPRLDATKSSRSTHALVSHFGAVAAAAVLYRLDERGVRHALSYAAQSASGINSWVRDVNHVEKAFVFAGMPSSDGVRAAAIVESGCDGVDDVFSSQPNFLDAFSGAPDRGVLIEGLGEVFEIVQTNIKKFAVGSPAQAAVQAAINLQQREQVDVADIEAIEIVLPHDLARVVDGRTMPDINCQYLVAGTLIDGGFSFAMAHDVERMAAPDIVRLMALSTLVPDPEVEGRRTAELKVRLRDGRELSEYVAAVRGTVDDPMSVDEIEEKARDLFLPSLGAEGTERLLSELWALPDSSRGIEDIIALVAGGPR